MSVLDPMPAVRLRQNSAISDVRLLQKSRSEADAPAQILGKLRYVRFGAVGNWLSPMSATPQALTPLHSSVTPCSRFLSSSRT
jgi:hypothetical protein